MKTASINFNANIILLARAHQARKASVSRNIKDKNMESRNTFPNPRTEENSPKAHLWTCPLCNGHFMKGWKRHSHVQRCNAHLHNPTLEKPSHWRRQLQRYMITTINFIINVHHTYPTNDFNYMV